MKFVKTKTGRLIEGETPWGSFRIEVEQSASDLPLKLVTTDGREVGTASITMTQPATAKPTADQLAVADARAEICGQCKFKRGITRKAGAFDVHTVKCDECGCEGLSLINGKCPLDLW